MSTAAPEMTRDSTAAAPPPQEPDAPEERGLWPKLAVGGLLLLILGTGLWIRLRNNGYGLPFVYNYDEATHFTNRAVGMFGGNFDPGYYQNPSGFTYLIYVAVRFWHGILPNHLHFGTISKQFAANP